jgi:hypothetical protein
MVRFIACWFEGYGSLENMKYEIGSIEWLSASFDEKKTCGFGVDKDSVFAGTLDTHSKKTQLEAPLLQ